MNFKKTVSYETIIFFILLSVIFLLEGLGFNSSRIIAFFLILITPFVLYSFNFFQKKRDYNYPKSVTLLGCLFFFATAISIIFSVDIQRSFEYGLFYSALFLWFLYVFNNKDIIAPFITWWLIGISVIFCFYSMLLYFPVGDILTPETGYQLVFPTYGHNHLGDFIGITIITILYLLWSKRSSLWIILFAFVPFYIFSFSRTAYWGVIAVLSMMIIYFSRMKKNSARIILLGGMISIIACISFLVSTLEFRKIPMLRPISIFLSENFELKEKTFQGSRPEYLYESIAGLKERPFFGFGPNNFQYVSLKHSTIPNIASESSHNIFLDIFVENGVFSGIFFIIIVIFFVKNSKKNIFFFCFLFLFLSFQTDYTYRIYSLMVLSVIYAALMYTKASDGTATFGKLYGISIGIASVVVLISISTLLLGKNNSGAFFTYPLQKGVYPLLIEQAIASKNSKDVNTFMKFYTVFFSGDTKVLNYTAQKYEHMGNKKKALHYYEEEYYKTNLPSIDLVIKVYGLKKTVENQNSADQFISLYLAGIKDSSKPIPFTYKSKLITICKEKKYFTCPQDLWMN